MKSNKSNLLMKILFQKTSDEANVFVTEIGTLDLKNT